MQTLLKYKKIKFTKNQVFKIFSKKFFNKANCEIKGFDYFKKKKIFFLVKRNGIFKNKKITINYEKIPLHKINIFFKINKVYAVKKIEYKKINIDLYFNYLKNEINSIQIKNFLEDIKKKLKQTYNVKKIYVSPAHGDFAHYNVLFDGNKFYVIDFEFFNKNAVFGYDLFNWYYSTFINKCVKFRLFYVSDILSKFLFKLLKFYNFGYNKKLFKEFYNKIYLDIFFLEKMIFYYKETKSNKIEKKDLLKKIYFIQKILLSNY